MSRRLKRTLSKNPDEITPFPDPRENIDFLPLFVELSRSDGYWVVSKLFVHYFQDVEKAIFLSELISKYHYFKTKGTLTEGEWFYLIYEDITKSTYITLYKLRQIIKNFIDNGLIDVEMKGLPAKQYYRINTRLIYNLLAKSSMITSPTENNRTIDNENNRTIDNENNRAYNNKRPNNKRPNNKDININVNNDSSNQKKTSSHDSPEDYSNEVQSLFQHWQGLGIRKHKPSKTRDHALQQLNIYIHRYSIEDITKSMDRYKQLLNDEYSILSDESPYKVGLDEFFGFSRHTKTRIKQSYSKLNGIKSWFEECRKEDLSPLMRVGKNPYPLIAQALKKEFKERIGPVSDSTHHENLFRKASRLLMDFHSLNKDKLTIQLQNKPGIFAKCFIEYIESSKSKNGKHPGWLCTDVTWEVFPVWLSEKGYTSEENDTLSDYR